MSISYTTVHRVPLGGTLTIDQIYYWRCLHSPDDVAFVYPRYKDDLVSMTWKSLSECIGRGVEIIQDQIPEVGDGQDARQEAPIVVGMLSTADIISSTIFLFSHFRFTHPRAVGRALIPFPISPRNSAAAVAHLTKITGVKYLWVTEGPMRSLANDVIRQGGLVDAVILSFPSFSDLQPGTTSLSSSTSDDFVFKAISLDTPAVILHSSGSTAFPKPRILSHQILLEMGRASELGDLNLRGETLAVHGLPLFHGMGIAAALWSAVSGITRAAPSPRSSAPPVTPETLLQQVIESKSTAVFCVPSFLETWSEEPESIQAIKPLKAILWGGAPLNEEAGRFLYEQGINIRNIYGATEFGCVTILSGKAYPEGYEWFQFAPNSEPVLIPEQVEQGVYEVVFQETETHHLATNNTFVDGVPAYATGDLVQQHKSNPKLFKIIGRKDDQITLSTGEKTNPGPLETIIIRNPHVKRAMIFGRGRTSNGVLIEPLSHQEVASLGIENFRNFIWHSIEEANEFAPAHSRIFKEMILFTAASKPFSYTFKSTPRRELILKNYSKEIDAAYKAVEDSLHTDIPIPSGSSEKGGWTMEESLQFVRSAVCAVMNDTEKIGDKDDLFWFGCDSLQATYIRNTILHALRQIAPPANVQMAPSNFVYQNPTIRSLAMFAAQMSHAATPNVGLDLQATRNERLQTLVEKYTQDWPVHRPSKKATEPTEEVILLTGSTGGLGSQLLAQLVVTPIVSRIYAFNRPGEKRSRVRQLEVFFDRGNDIRLLDSEKIVYVEGDTAVEGFNISPELFQEIRESVTTIIHNAWRVDFNISLGSFEPAIRGVRQMIDLALGSPHHLPPRVVFTSSVGILKAWADIPPVPEGPITDLSLVNTSGYSESKWISERVLSIASQSTPLRPLIIRVGQLSGGINGNWNVNEWFPSLARAGQIVGGLPDNEGVVSFIPVHVAASAVIELRHTPNQFVHLVHPRPVPWSTIIQYLSEALNLPVIRYLEWLDRLEALPHTEVAFLRNPALHLLDFYRLSATPKGIQAVEGREAMGLSTYETKVSQAEAPSLSACNLPQLRKEDVQSWIGYWKGKGFFKG